MTNHPTNKDKIDFLYQRELERAMEEAFDALVNGQWFELPSSQS